MGLNQTLAESNASMGNLSGLMASLLITIIVSIIIILVVYFSYWVTIKKEEGIYIQPFEVGICNEEFNGRAISDILVFELHRIHWIHKLNLPGIEQQPKENLVFRSAAPSSENPTYEITNVSVSSDSVTLNLGQILLVLKREIGHPGNAIVGSIQRYGTNTKLVAWMGPERTGVCAWQVERNDANIPALIKDVAFMIAKDISEEDIQAKNWQAFKFYTEALDCYHQYLLTADKEQLNCSKDNCLRGLDYEKDYEDLNALILNLAMAYERQ